MELQSHLISPFSGTSLRAYVPEDNIALAHILLDPRSWNGGMNPTSHTRRPESVEDALEVINGRHSTSIIYAIINASGDVIGATGITNHIPEKSRVQIGRTILHPNYWGRGLNHEVKLVMLDWLFSMGIGRIELEVDSQNTNSLNSLIAFGFTREGVRRRAVCTPDGQWKDMTIFSMITEEWSEKRSLAVAKIQERQSKRPDALPVLLG